MVTASSERLTVTMSEFASAMGISRGQAYELARRGELPVPVIRFGKRLVVPKSAMLRLLEAGASEPAAQPGKGE